MNPSIFFLIFEVNVKIKADVSLIQL